MVEIDRVLRLIDREVWVITAATPQRRGGLVATWVSAASIDPARPLLLAGLAPNHFTTELVRESKAFAAHLLRADQFELAWNFARDSGHERDKLTGLAVKGGTTGSPILADCLAWCECQVFARYDAGDRLFFWADVMGGGSDADAPQGPLRERGLFAELSAEQRRQLIANREADMAALRPLQEQWRRLISPAELA
jgi:flavin reductase (DIM6/NTAB) family NADH-FMN oxidoreductase RutF